MLAKCLKGDDCTCHGGPRLGAGCRNEFVDDGRGAQDWPVDLLPDWVMGYLAPFTPEERGAKLFELKVAMEQAGKLASAARRERYCDAAERGVDIGPDPEFMERLRRREHLTDDFLKGAS